MHKEDWERLRKLRIDWEIEIEKNCKHVKEVHCEKEISKFIIMLNILFCRYL